MLEIKHKLAALLAQLNEGLVDRDEAMKLALLSLLAGENILLVGPPGTAKSLISRQVAKALKDDDKEGSCHFEYLLTKFSTPEEIFGPLSISKLKEDRFERNTAGYLPSAQVAFLDEIFKASSSILNALLTILNERIYHNGAAVQKVPLRSLIAASNELPTGQEELSALYDRFLLRSFVDYVSEKNLHKLFTLGNSEHLEHLTPLTLGELAELDKQATSVKLPELIQKAILDIWKKHNKLFKEDRREGLSDRRLVKVIHLLKVSALTNDRDEVDLSDLMLLRYCLWNHIDNKGKVISLIHSVLRPFSQISSKGNRDKVSYNQVISTNNSGRSSSDKSTGIIPGLEGKGTEDDPILIKNLHDFGRLEEESVGGMGYFFRQTAKLDLAELKTLPIIELKGSYDGADFTIQGRGKKEALFNNILPSSAIKNLQVLDCSLSNNSTGSDISFCKVGQTMFLNSVSDCKITGCVIAGSLANQILNNSKISNCYIHGRSIGDDYPKLSILVDSCDIMDCLFYIDSCDYGYRSTGGVAHTCKNSMVERCFITGAFTVSSGAFSYSTSGCFTANSENNKIKNCALGLVSTSADRFYGFCSSRSTTELLGNVSVGTNKFSAPDDIINGRLVDEVRFNQGLLQHSLGWDFENIWQWNDQANSPRLQSVGLSAAKSPISEQAPESDKIDLLVQQMNANLWV